MSFDGLLNGDYGAVPTYFPALVLGVLLALAGGHVISWAYRLTHAERFYSHSLAKSLGTIYLSFTKLGKHRRPDLVLNLSWLRPLTEVSELEYVLVRHSGHCHCANGHSTQNNNVAYPVPLRDFNRVEGDLHPSRR